MIATQKSYTRSPVRLLPLLERENCSRPAKRQGNQDQKGLLAIAVIFARSVMILRSYGKIAGELWHREMCWSWMTMWIRAGC
jgi:hypothetical protein